MTGFWAGVAFFCLLLAMLAQLVVNKAQVQVNQASYEWLKSTADALQALIEETAPLAADLDELKREVRLEARR